jgi:YidC/Oxa1 family membrane protein insertase
VLAEIAPFQSLLNGIGWVLAWLYDVVGNFGIAIIILTIAFRIVLLPIGIKQIKSMQLMQALQPKIKEIQKKYKGDRQKAQEETMKLYQEYGANPLSGCLITLLQFPILIAMYSVIRAPIPYADSDPSKPPGVECQAQENVPLPPECFKNNHLPVESQLFTDITEHNETGQHFGLMNLQCSAAQSGRTVPVLNTKGNPSGDSLNCGDSTADRIPYFVLLALMIGTTYYSSRQTQRATPATAQTGTTQILTRVMPLTFGIFGFAFPAGLVLYWTVSSGFQIGQQSVMLRLGHIGPAAMDRRLAQMKEKATAKGDKPRSGLMGGLMDRADQERKRRQPNTATARKPPPRTPGKGTKGGTTKPRPKGSTSGRPKGSGPNRRNRPKGSGR